MLYVYQTIRQQGRCLSCVSIKPKTTQEISVLYVYQTITKKGVYVVVVLVLNQKTRQEIYVLYVYQTIRQPGRHLSFCATKLEDLTRGILFMFVPDYDNNNNSIDFIERYISRCYFFTISSLRHELSPTCSLKWPGCNPLQCIGRFSRAMSRVPHGTKGQLSC